MAGQCLGKARAACLMAWGVGWVLGILVFMHQIPAGGPGQLSGLQGEMDRNALVVDLCSWRNGCRTMSALSFRRTGVQGLFLFCLGWGYRSLSKKLVWILKMAKELLRGCK